MSGENDKPSTEIIQGPWGKSKRKVKLPDKDIVEMQENVAFADHLTETLMVQMIHTISENGYNVTEKSFIGSMGFIIETVKASLYKEMGLKHPMTRMMDILTAVSDDDEDHPVTEVNIEEIELIADILEKEGDDDDPELA